MLHQVMGGLSHDFSAYIDRLYYENSFLGVFSLIASTRMRLVSGSRRTLAAPDSTPLSACGGTIWVGIRSCSCQSGLASAMVEINFDVGDLLKNILLRSLPWAVILEIASTTLLAQAMHEYSQDLQSLAFESTQVIEVRVLNVTEKENVTWGLLDVLTCKALKVFAGTAKTNDQFQVALTGGYEKKDSGKLPLLKQLTNTLGLGKIKSGFATGDELILFLRPASEKAIAAGIPYFDVVPGVKVIDGVQVTGFIQDEKPGPYVNSLKEGDLNQFEKKVQNALNWAKSFKREFSEKKNDGAWLVANLEQRLPVTRMGDKICEDLCQALAATHDRSAISRARTLYIKNNRVDEDYYFNLLNNPNTN